MPKQNLFEQLQTVENTFAELTSKLCCPDTAKNPDEFIRIAKERLALEELIGTYNDWKKTQQELVDTHEILNKSQEDPEMYDIAEQEIDKLRLYSEFLENRLSILLLPRDPNDDKNIFLEICVNSVGDESALWVCELIHMYNRYAQTKDWNKTVYSY